MKSAQKIGAKILSVYFLTLPILFGIHAFHHQHHDEFHPQEEIAYSWSTPDCDLCDLYQNQTAVVETPFVFDYELVIAVFESRLSEDLIASFNYLTSIRGPPFS